MQWLIENFHYIFLFLGSAIFGYFFAIKKKKNKLNITFDGFPISPRQYQQHFNQLDRRLYIYIDGWIPFTRTVVAGILLEKYFNDKTGNYCVDIITNIDGVQETNTFWGDTEEQAISKACCSVNQILLERINQ